MGQRTRWEAIASLAAIFLAMLCVSWGRWPDVLVDYGNELYAAWQISEGGVFGRDVRLVATGPLSVYLNGFLFMVFGPELRIQVAFNLIIVALLTWLLHELLRGISDGRSATIACMTFLAVFAFGCYDDVGNYNYVTPYSHGVTYGLVLALLSLWLLQAYATRRDRRLLGAAGFALGLVFLTKPEIFVAAAAAAGVWCGAVIHERGWTRRALAEPLVLVGAASTAPAIATALLMQRIPAGEAWRAVLTPWLVMATPLARTPFYVRGMGLDAPGEGFVSITLGAFGYCAAAALGLGAVLAVRRLGVSSRSSALVVFTVVILMAGLFVPSALWSGVARPLPLVVLVGVGIYAWRAGRKPRTGEQGQSTIPGLAFSIFVSVR